METTILLLSIYWENGKENATYYIQYIIAQVIVSITAKSYGLDTAPHPNKGPLLRV